MTRTMGKGSGGTSIHISLQGKGGVGKRLISAVLSQYFRRLGCVHY
jgi:MinD-like ATPase involved in chromosome partitioning or flagellar assembly